MSWSEIWLCAFATVEASAVCTSTICEVGGTANWGPGRAEVRAADATVISSFTLGANPGPIPPATPPAKPPLRMAKDLGTPLLTDKVFWVLGGNLVRTAFCPRSVCGTFCGATGRRSNNPGEG